MNREDAFAAINTERNHQDRLYDLLPGNSMESHLLQVAKIGHYTGKLQGAVLMGRSDEFRRRLIQVAALCVQGLEALDMDEPAEETLVEHIRRTA